MLYDTSVRFVRMKGLRNVFQLFEYQSCCQKGNLLYTLWLCAENTALRTTVLMLFNTC